MIRWKRSQQSEALDRLGRIADNTAPGSGAGVAGDPRRDN